MKTVSFNIARNVDGARKVAPFLNGKRETNKESRSQETGARRKK
jgi:hypothetical protein